MRNILITFLLTSIGFASPVTAQLASGIKSADQLIVDYLLTADEIQSNCCVRITGTKMVSSKGSNVPVVVDFVGITARSANTNSAFFAAGTQSLVSPDPHGYRWQEVLRIGEDYYDRHSVGNTPLLPPKPRNRQPQTDPSKIRIEPFFAFIDPMGLALCTEGALLGNLSNVANLQAQFLKHQFRSSTTTESGDIEGLWIVNEKFAVQVRFGRDVEFMPVETKYIDFDAKSDTLKECRSTTTTKWKRYTPKVLVPAHVEMREKRIGDVETVENSFDFEWLPLSTWEKKAVNFQSLLAPERSVWRDKFLELFEPSNPR